MDPIKANKSLVEQTYETLLEAISSGEFSPGERLNQDEIAARLNVSRQPVNSAISILKANRFVEDTGRRGVIVSAIEPNQFRSMYEFRRVIEPLAVSLAGERLTGDAFGEAEDIIQRGKTASRERDLKNLLKTDIEFHEMIYRWSGNQVIEDFMRVNWHHIRRFMVEVLKEPSAADRTWDDHARIVQSLLDHDTAAAVAEMSGHIERAFEKTKALLVRNKAYDASSDSL